MFYFGIVIQDGAGIDAATADIPATNVGDNPNPIQVSNIHVVDHHMPAAAIITRIMRRVIPDHSRIDDDACKRGDTSLRLRIH